MTCDREMVVDGVRVRCVLGEGHAGVCVGYLPRPADVLVSGERIHRR